MVKLRGTIFRIANMQFSQQTMIHTHTTRRDSGNATSAFPLFLSSKISPRPPSKKKPKIIALSARACNSGPSAGPERSTDGPGGRLTAESVVRPTVTGQHYSTVHTRAAAVPARADAAAARAE